MKITIIGVGKIKEKFYRDGISEYTKRLSRYCKLEMIEVGDEKTPDAASEAINVQIREREGERIIKVLPQDAHLIALTIDGQSNTSEQLAEKINMLGIRGTSHIVFIIGGSLGLSKQVIQRCKEQLSFSKMTFPHQLMRLILLEQVYRSYRIIQHEPYHK